MSPPVFCSMHVGLIRNKFFQKISLTSHCVSGKGQYSVLSNTSTRSSTRNMSRAVYRLKSAGYTSKDSKRWQPRGQEDLYRFAVPVHNQL
jgi:hypothetical protein